MSATNENFYSFGKAHNLLPKEEMLEVKQHHCSLTIGIPKENAENENRIALVPDAISLLIQSGHKVIVEKEAGKAAHFPDHEYAEEGAEIVNTATEIYANSDIVIKVAPLTMEEIDLVKPRQTIISTLNLTTQSETYIKKLISKKITAIGFEFIKDKTKIYSVVRAMSEIAGNTSILIASEYLSNTSYGKGTMLGGFSGITPTEVVILGAGTVGEYAARAAMGLGATVKVFDNSIYKLRRLQNNLNVRIFTSIIHPKVLLKSLKTAHVVIGAIHSNEGRTPCIVCEDMVKEMKYGSIIIDVSIDQGGCFETSMPTQHNNPVYKKHGVTHYCVPNIASKVPHTASYALSNIFAPILQSMGDAGGINNKLINDYGVRQGVYMYNGTLTSKLVGERFNLPYQDLDLLMAAFSKP